MSFKPRALQHFSWSIIPVLQTALAWRRYRLDYATLNNARAYFDEYVLPQLLRHTADIKTGLEIAPYGYKTIGNKKYQYYIYHSVHEHRQSPYFSDTWVCSDAHCLPRYNPHECNERDREITQLKRQYYQLQQWNAALLTAFEYQPGNIGYQKVKRDFDGRVRCVKKKESMKSSSRHYARE
jgi:hypothetical protein